MPDRRYGAAPPETETEIANAVDLTGANCAGAKLRGMIVDPDQTMVIAVALGLDVRSEGAP
jgi:hypothetical protein